MATKVTNEEIININEIYAECKNITKTAELCGRSTSTVRKYIIKDYIPSKEEPNYDEVLIEIDPSIEKLAADLMSEDKYPRGLSCLTIEEMGNLHTIWEEIRV